MTDRRIIILTILMLYVMVPVFAVINGPTANFQVRWHVENHENNYCDLTILDFTGQTEVLNGAELALAYTIEWQGLFVLQYRTNMIRQNHTLQLAFKPLAAAGQTSLGFSVKYIIADESSLAYDGTTREWTWDLRDNSVLTGQFTVYPNTVNYADSGLVPFLAQHPTDADRPIVTKLIPVSLMLTTLTAVEGVAYYSDIEITVVTP